MTEYEFTLILENDPNEDEAERLYSIFDDGTIATIAGVPRVDFHRSRETLTEAIRSAIDDVERGGAKVHKIELKPHALFSAKARVSG